MDISNKEIEKFAERGHSIVVLDRTTEHRNIRQVLLDNRGGATRQLSNLSMWVQKGSSAFWTRKGYDSQERLAVSTRELTRFGIPYEIIKAILPNLLVMLLLKILSQPQTEPVDVLLLMMKWRSVSINMLRNKLPNGERHSDYWF